MLIIWQYFAIRRFREHLNPFIFSFYVHIIKYILNIFIDFENGIQMREFISRNCTNYFNDVHWTRSEHGTKSKVQLKCSYRQCFENLYFNIEYMLFINQFASLPLLETYLFLIEFGRIFYSTNQTVWWKCNWDKNLCMRRQFFLKFEH